MFNITNHCKKAEEKNPYGLSVFYVRIGIVGRVKVTSIGEDVEGRKPYTLLGV